MAVDVLGRGVDDDIGAEPQRLLEIGRGEGVVNDHLDLGIVLVSDPGDFGDVHDLQCRVAGGLEVHDLCLWRQGCFQSLQIGQIQELCRDAKLAHAVIHQRKRAAIERVRGENLIPCDHRTPERCGDRTHTGCSAEGSLAAFQSGDFLFRHIHSGVGETGIDKAVFLSGKTPAALLNRAELKGGGLINRCSQSACGILMFAGMDLFCGKSAFVEVEHCSDSPFQVSNS